MKWLATCCVLVLAAGAAAAGALDPSWDHSTKVSVTPQAASPSDEILVTVSRWVQAGYEVVGSTLRPQGNIIRLDLHWVQTGCVIAVWPPPYSRKKHTESIGKWSPGTYTVIVNNDGRDMGVASFTVTAETSEPAPAGETAIDRLRRLFPTLWPW